MISDAIFDNLMTMIKEVSAYKFSNDPENKKMIEMFAHIPIVTRVYRL